MLNAIFKTIGEMLRESALSEAEVRKVFIKEKVKFAK